MENKERSKPKVLNIDFQAGIEALQTLSEIQNKINESTDKQEQLYLLKNVTQMFYVLVDSCNENVKHCATAFVTVAEKQLKEAERKAR